LLVWRGEIARGGHLEPTKRLAMKLGSQVLRRPWLYRLLGAVARKVVPYLPRLLVYNRFNPWGRQRELPPMPAASFREQYRKRHDESRKNSAGPA
jgi:L-lactate dehydrogenase complex protein LldF